ncbi:MAG: hypothetical protein ABI948_00950 [Thermoleophilia bacterium]
MTDASGVSAADGVLTEEQVDQPAGQSSTGDSAASAPGTAAGEGTQGRQKGGGRVGLFGASLFGIFVLGVGLILVYILIKIWPKVPQGTGSGRQAAGGQPKQPAPIDLFWGLFKFNLLAETALIVLTAVMGGIGATVFIAVSFSDYVGNKRFERSWLWFYLVRFFVGPALAVIFYFTLRGGFLATSSSGSDINPYGVAAMAGLVGLFSKQAGDKLHQVFDALFQVDASHGDAARGDGVANPKPTISGIQPDITTTTETLTFTLQGTGFTEQSTVAVGTSETGDEPAKLVARISSYANETALNITLLKSDVAKPGQLWIAVTNPEPGGGTAGPHAFDISGEAILAAEAGTDESGDAAPAVPAPTITGLDPVPNAGAENPTVTIQGSGFAEGATVSAGRTFDGEAPQLDPRETSFLSDTQLQITLTGDDVSQPGQLWIGVANPDGGAAEPQSYTIE